MPEIVPTSPWDMRTTNTLSVLKSFRCLEKRIRASSISCKQKSWTWIWYFTQFEHQLSGSEIMLSVCRIYLCSQVLVIYHCIAQIIEQVEHGLCVILSTVSVWFQIIKMSNIDQQCDAIWYGIFSHRVNLKEYII